MTFEAWKMVFLNSMTFHDQAAPCSALGGLETAHPEGKVVTILDLFKL